MCNFIAIAWLETLLSRLDDTVAVDHGHKKSSGETFVAIVLKPTPVQRAVTTLETVGGNLALVQEDAEEDPDESPAKRQQLLLVWRLQAVTLHSCRRVLAGKPSACRPPSHPRPGWGERQRPGPL